MLVPNIGPQQRRKRITGGWVFLLITFAFAGALIALDAPRAWRLLIIFPAAASAIGFFQARASTCVALAAHGSMNMDDGNRKVTDPESLACLRVQSRGVYVKTAVAAILAAAIFLLV